MLNFDFSDGIEQASLSEVGLIDHDLRIEEVYDHANN